MELDKIHTYENGSDILTNVLPRVKFEFFRTVSRLVLPYNYSIKGVCWDVPPIRSSLNECGLVYPMF